jgi:hypothetical protein
VIDGLRRTSAIRSSETNEPNEAYESFSGACYFFFSFIEVSNGITLIASANR